ncbi:major facilitator superfamily domain-containing protein [Dipodascopsis tothii]|uniref:major facilitator superfamily domain-containing protein n=1 Tax=Dipodascopsis tothii TaxID=44089 RepID=UPI0034CDE975
MGIFLRFAEAIGWYPPGTSREERILLLKIDWLVLSFSSLSMFNKNLDVNALTNAYVSGMKTDLNLYGNRLNYINALYYVGYTIFQVPSNLVLIKIPGQYYLPACEVAWGILTLATAFVKDYKSLMAVRFLVGLTSTAAYVGNAHIINSWYKRSELGKRNAIYSCVSPLGYMFAGYLQSAAYTNLDGVGGMHGWQWLFIICAIITIPSALIGYLFCPNVPGKSSSPFLTPREKELCVTRLEADGFTKSLGLNWSLVRRVFGNWRMYVFVLISNAFSMTVYAAGTPYTLWLKAHTNPTYSVPMINNLGTITHGAAIVSYLVFGFYSDWRGNRWESVLVGGILILVCNIMLVVWNISDPAKFFAFIGLGVASGPTAMLMPWLAEAVAHDLEARAVCIAMVNLGWVVFVNLIVPLVAWPTVSAPRYPGGYIWALCWSVIQLALIPLPIYLERRDVRRGVVPAPPGMEVEVARDEAGETPPDEKGGVVVAVVDAPSKEGSLKEGSLKEKV